MSFSFTTTLDCSHLGALVTIPRRLMQASGTDLPATTSPVGDVPTMVHA